MSPEETVTVHLFLRLSYFTDRPVSGFTEPWTGRWPTTGTKTSAQNAAGAAQFQIPTDNHNTPRNLKEVVFLTPGSSRAGVHVASVGAELCQTAST